MAEESNNQEGQKSESFTKKFLEYLGIFGVPMAIVAIVFMVIGVIWWKTNGLQGGYGGQSYGYTYVPDQYFYGPQAASSTSADAILSVMNTAFHLSTEYYRPYVQQIVQKSQEKQVNPGVVISVWGKEQGFKNPDKAFGCGHFSSSDSGFSNQLECATNTMVKAANNQDPYHYDDASKPIFVRWIDRYTPLSDPRNSADRDNFAKYLKAFIPNQVVEEKTNIGVCSQDIIKQAEIYQGINRWEILSGNSSYRCSLPIELLKQKGTDCSGFVSRVYMDLKLLPEGSCLTTATIPSNSNLKEISASQIQPGDLILSPGHVVIYVSGDVKSNFMVWESGGNVSGGDQTVRLTSRLPRPPQRYFRSINCLTSQ